MAKNPCESAADQSADRARRAWLAGLVAAPFLPWPHTVWAQAAKPTRVYGANPVVTYLLAALAPETLLGWNFPPPPQSRGFFSETALAKPVIGGFFGQGKSPNEELLLAARPELAIVSGAAAVGTSVSETQLNALGIPVKNLTLDKVADYPAAIELLGEWLGITARVQPAADLCRSLLAQLNSLPMPKPAPVIYYAEQDNGLATECPGSFHAEVLDLVHATNPVRCPKNGVGGFGMVRISLETLYQMNPEWILTQDKPAARTVLTDARYAELAAVKNEQVVLAPQIPFRWIDRPPSFMRILAAFWLYDRLYPGHHRFDLSALTKTFVHTFFNVTMDDDAVHAMLNPMSDGAGTKA
jgi:iron complex transport system substrate-binding protein